MKDGNGKGDRIAGKADGNAPEATPSTLPPPQVGTAAGGSEDLGGGGENYNEKQEAATTTLMRGGGSIGGGSWKELKDDAVVAVGRLRPSESQGSSKKAVVKEDSVSVSGDGVDIELEETRNRSISSRGGDGVSRGGSQRERPRIGADALIHESRHREIGPDGTALFYKVYKRRWFGVAVLTFLNIIASWDWETFAPISRNAARFFATDQSSINWLSTAFFFAFPVVAPVVIYVLHWGPRPSIITASVLILVGNWVRYGGVRAGGPNGNFGVVMFGQILTGFAQPFVLAAPTRYSDLWFTNRGRVAATALMSLANPFGAAIGQLITTTLVTKPEDIPSMVLYVSIIASVISIPGFFVPAEPPTPAAPSAETSKATLRESVKVLASSPEFWMLFIPFAVYVGLFNSSSSLLAQILNPYGYTDDEAGLGGAVLIAVGLVSSGIASPIIDRTKGFVASIKIFVPVIALSYIIFIWMPQTRDSAGLAGPYVIFALLGASSFSLLPVAVELLVEFTHPVSPEVTSTLGWSGGQILGGVFVIISDALKAGPDASPPLNMSHALIFQAVIAAAVVPIPLCLGLFGRAEKIELRRVASDLEAMEEMRDIA